MQLDRELIEAALIGLQHKRDEIDARMEQLRRDLGEAKPDTGRATAKRNQAPRKKRVLSAEGRARIVAALKKRWAAQKAVAEEGEGQAPRRKASGKPGRKRTRKAAAQAEAGAATA